MKNTDSKLEDLVRVVRTHPEAPFYRSAWGKAASFEELPSIGREDFVAAPLSQRRYKKGKELVKMVHAFSGIFASAWSFEDSARERFGTALRRPMVWLESPHEALEKSLWCCEQGAVPLIAEQNAEVALYGGGVYRVDSLITDITSFKKAESYAREHAKQLEAISVLGHSFSEEELSLLSPYAEKVRLILCLPETGAFAEAAFARRPIFTPHEGVLLEHREELVLTKLSYLTTPIIRYRTGIRTEEAADGPAGSFTIARS